METTDNSTYPGHLKKNMIFPNYKVFRYFDYPFIFPDPSAASNGVGCLNLINRSRNHGKLDCTASREVKVPENSYMSLLQLPFEAVSLAKHVPITYTFVDHLPLTNIKKVFYCVQLLYDIYLLIS